MEIVIRLDTNVDVSNNITGVDIVIIKRFRTILKTMTSGYI
jgi:hypothetical protein